MLTLKSLPEADRFVSRQKRLGNDVRWDGWEIVFFRADDRGFTTPRGGAFRGGKWGFENRSRVTDKGTWEVDYRNVKRAKHNRK